MNRSRIWIPENLNSSPIEQLSTIIPLNFTLQGYFTADLINRNGEVISSWHFPNVITDTFMNGIGSGSFDVTGIVNSLSRLRAGTGSAIPSASDTNLQAPIGNFVTANGGISDEWGFVSGSSPSGTYQYIIRSRLFDFNDASGTITELAWFTTRNNTALVRSLVRDQFGVPTSITKTNDEQLRVRYELRMIMPTVTSSFELIVGNTTHSAVLYPNNIDATLSGFSSNWGFVFNSFGGNSWTVNNTQIHMVAYSSYSFSGGTWNPLTEISVFNRGDNDIKSASLYINNSFYRDTSHSFAATNDTVNSYPSGIMAIGLSPVVNTTPSQIYNFNYPWVITVNPPIQKSDIQRLDLYVRWRWARSGTESL